MNWESTSCKELSCLSNLLEGRLQFTIWKLLVPKDSGGGAASSEAVCKRSWCQHWQPWNILEVCTGPQEGRMCPFDRTHTKKKRKKSRARSPSVSHRHWGTLKWLCFLATQYHFWEASTSSFLILESKSGQSSPCHFQGCWHGPQFTPHDRVYPQTVSWNKPFLKVASCAFFITMKAN